MSHNRDSVEQPWWMQIESKAVNDFEDIQDQYHLNRRQTVLTSLAERVQQRKHKDEESIDRLLSKRQREEILNWQFHIDEYLRHRETVADRYKRKENLGHLKSRNRLAVEEEDIGLEGQEDGDQEASAPQQEASSPRSPRSPGHKKSLRRAAKLVLDMNTIKNSGRQTSEGRTPRTPRQRGTTPRRETSGWSEATSGESPRSVGRTSKRVPTDKLQQVARVGAFKKPDRKSKPTAESSPRGRKDS